MPLQIMQNLYPASWLYLTGHCYVRSMFVKHHFVSLVVCLFAVAVVVVVAVFYYYHYYYYLLLLLFIYFYYYYYYLIGIN